MDYLLAIAGVILDVFNVAKFSPLVWIAIVVIGGLLAPLWAFHRLRVERDGLRERLSLPPAEDEPTIFEHRLFPWFAVAAGMFVVGGLLALVAVWFGREHLQRDVIHEFDTKIEMEIIGPDGKKVEPNREENQPTK